MEVGVSRFQVCAAVPFSLPPLLGDEDPGVDGAVVAVLTVREGLVQVVATEPTMLRDESGDAEPKGMLGVLGRLSPGCSVQFANSSGTRMPRAIWICICRHSVRECEQVRIVTE